MAKSSPKRFMMIFLVFGCMISMSCASRQASDLMAEESIDAPAYKVQSVTVGSTGKYGYPFLVAPTLAPFIQTRSDDDDEVAAPQAKAFGSRLSTVDGEVPIKKAHLKKLKIPPEAAARRHDEDVSAEKVFRSYKEPKYRNLEELEAAFRPKRRMDGDFSYSQYEYARPVVSPRDPYLSPSDEPTDSFYPSSGPKVKSYPSSYESHVPKYGAGKYEDPLPYHDDSYGEPTPDYPSAKDHYNYKDYAIKSNEPIMGDIRKRLLDYAGASDLYEGEPDYLREVARNKHKYSNIGNDYYSYGGQSFRDSYRDFPYVESKISLIKKSRHV